MTKKNLVNTETDRNVLEFVAQVQNHVRREDARRLVEIMCQVTGKEPKIWGQSIIAFGKYKYQRKNGDEFEWFNVGFSPGKAHLTIYLMFDIKSQPSLLDALGPHRAGKGCLYIKRLDDVAMEPLIELIKKSDRWQKADS